MSKSFKISPDQPAVITANDLRMGHCVWMTDNGWTDNPRDALVIEDENRADLALLEAEAQGHVVVGPYLAQVRLGPDGPEPTHFREEFRRVGPSNYFHGKQVELAIDAAAANDTAPATASTPEVSHV